MIAFEGDEEQKDLPTFEQEKKRVLDWLSMQKMKARDFLEDNIYCPNDDRVNELLNPLDEIIGWVRELAEGDEYELQTATSAFREWALAIEGMASLTDRVRAWYRKRIDAGEGTGPMNQFAPWGANWHSGYEIDDTTAEATVPDKQQDAAPPGSVVTYPSSLTVKGQTFTFVETRPYVTKNGETTAILIWKSKCQSCGCEYEYTSPRAIDRSKFIFACAVHRSRKVKG